ncbi:MAG: TonB-dependent receptor plug domain-containing protein, partial [Muribaculaceae bacterium]|nr:TonB-dependent receptor plug domain-containing protein [Muribaculaceae bacterium]
MKTNRPFCLTVMLLIASTVLAIASEPFNGLLLDFKGKPIKGAKIYVHNPKHYAKSDKLGRFGLTDVKGNDTLHIVYKKHVYDVEVDGAKGMSIKIDEYRAMGTENEELVLAGMGYVKKREYLGPLGSVTGEQLAATGETDLIKAMRGKIPGVHVIETANGVNVNVRNTTSFNAGTSPLWIVDGMESKIPPSLTVMEVEKVDVIKDGAGYGTRGANGVI